MSRHSLWPRITKEHFFVIRICNNSTSLVVNNWGSLVRVFIWVCSVFLCLLFLCIDFNILNVTALIILIITRHIIYRLGIELRLVSHLMVIIWDAVFFLHLLSSSLSRFPLRAFSDMTNMIFSKLNQFVFIIAVITDNWVLSIIFFVILIRVKVEATFVAFEWHVGTGEIDMDRVVVADTVGLALRHAVIIKDHLLWLLFLCCWWRCMRFLLWWRMFFWWRWSFFLL